MDHLQTANAYEITLDNADALASKYAFGSTLTIPAGTIDGVKATKYIVIAPSGNGYNSETITLSEAGRYTIKWYAQVGGKEVSAEKTFLVEKGVYSAEGKVTCEYMEDLEHAQFANYENGTFTKEDVTFEGDGIKVTVGDESKFTYNNVIDLRNFSKDHFIEIFPYQQLWNVWTAPSGSYCEFKDDATNYLITLTDCYDPSNYVTIDLEYTENWHYAHRANAFYMNYRAGASGQVAHGLSKDDKGSLFIDGSKYSVSFAPMKGMSGTNTSQLGMKLYYDTETQRVYVSFADFICSKNDGVWNKRVLLADLANEDIYPDNAFKGFTTGEVYLSLSAKNIVDSTAKMDITSLGGLSGQAMLEMTQDREAPIIKTDEKLDAMKTIVVNEEISIPNALSFDPNNVSDLNAKVAVYYNYDPNSATNALVGIVNGKFTPKKTGAYTIVYTSEDSNGNSSKTLVELNCIEAAEGKAVTLNSATSTEHEAGAYVDIPECAISGVYTDDSYLKVYFVENGEEKLYTDSQIFLDKLGKFEFKYVYETPFATYTTMAEITSIPTDKVVMGAPALPEYFIKGASYTLDTVFAQEYTAVPTPPKAATMVMKADSGEYKQIDPACVTIDAENSVQFKYEYGTGVVESEVIKVLEVGFNGTLQMENYFHDEQDLFTKTAAKTYLQYVTKGSPEKATLNYINPLSLATFDIEFLFPSADKAGETYVSPASMTFTFTDYYDRNNVATFTLRPAKAGLFIDVNGVERVGQIGQRKFLDVKTYFSYSNGAINFEGAAYDLGTKFTNDKFLLSITLNGVEDGEACMQLSLLSDNTLKASKSDNANPKIYVAETNMGYHTLGKVITIGKAIASDIVAPYVESGLKVKVTTPSGAFAKSLDGIVLDGTNPVDRDYQITLDQIGFYSVIYTYTDQNGDFESFSYSPIIKDMQGPTIVVDGKVKDEVVSAKWGASVTVATYSVSDNMSAIENIDSCIQVIYPSAIMRKVPNGGSFYAEEKGRYTVVYYAYDEVGNAAMFTYHVQVD